VTGAEELPLLVVPAGGGEVAVPLEDVEEIIPSPRVLRDAQGDRLEGRDLPYVDLAAALGMGSAASPFRALVAGGIAYGIAGPGRVVRARAGGLRPLPPFLRAMEGRGILGVLAGEGRVIPVVDLRRLA
jgi:chemotaxis protein histidine kinase CheA